MMQELFRSSVIQSQWYSVRGNGLVRTETIKFKLTLTRRLQIESHRRIVL